MRRLAPKEKALLRKMGFIPKYFLKVSKDCESYTFVEVTSGKILVVRR